MSKPLIYNATVVSRDRVTDLLSIFRIAADTPLASNWFVPGQYCVIGMNNVAKPELGGVRRSMSLASAPNEGVAEFYVRYVTRPESDNPLTHLLWQLEKGDRMYMRPHAAGHFSIPGTVGEADPRARIMIAAGTGLAPFVAMVRGELVRNPSADLSKWVIVHGVSYAKDLGYRVELEAAAQKHGLVYVPTVSRPAEESNWQGATGRAEDQFAPAKIGAITQRLGFTGPLSPKLAAVFICGLRGTICDSICHLLDYGFVPDNRRLRTALNVPAEEVPSVYFEQYDTEPLLAVDSPEVMTPLIARMQAGLARVR